MLILKENAANSVPTPPVGKDTFFIDDSGTPSIKNSAGTVTTFPVVNASNAQVVFMNGSSLSGEAAFTYDFNNNVLNVTGNIAAGNVKTDNLLYANGTAWDLSDPGGSNTQIQFNDDESFGGSAAFTFDKSSNLVTVSANLNANNLNATTHITAGNVWANTGTISAQTLKGEAGNLSNITAGNITGQVANALVAGTVYTAAQPNITSVGTLTNLAVSGNAIISGNLTVDGNLVYVNVETVAVEDPIIQLQTGPNGATPSSNSGKDVGTALNYYDSQARVAFMGWDVSNAEFAFGSQTSITNEVVTFNTLGNARAQTFKGNVEAAGTSNIAAVNLGGHIIPTLDETYDLGNSTNRFRDLWISGNSIRIGNSKIKSNATSLILENPDGGQIVVSGNSTSSTTSIVNGNSNVNIPSANGNVNISATGVANVVVITSTGANITGTLNVTANSNVTNLGASGVIAATGNGTFGNVYANSGTVGASLLTGTLTTASQPNITTVGTLGNLSVTSNITAGNVKTDNLLYANGNPWDLSDPGGSNTQIQFNDDESFGGSAAFTFDKSSNLVTVGANLNANNLNATTHVTAGNVWANTGTVGASLLTGTLTTASQPNITSVGTLSSLTVTGNGTFGNVYANSGTIGASLLTGTLTTAAQPNVTSVGTLTSLAVTGNATAGNVYANSGTIGASLLTGTLTTNAQPNVTSVGTLTSLAVTGNTTAGNVYANSGTIGALTLKGEGGNISNVTAGNITGQVANALVAGTVYTAAQPNITSVGTLSSVTVSGNANVGNLGTAQVLASANVTAPQFISNITTGTAPLVVSSTTKVANLNADLLDGFSTATAATANTVVIRDADGSFSANVVTATLSGAATSAGTAGTVTTAAQPNITSVGTLTGLAVDGSNITLANGVYVGNAAGLTNIPGGNIVGNISGNISNANFAAFAAEITDASQPNITSVGTLTSLTVSGNANVGNLGTAGLITATGNVSGGNITTAGLVSATGNVSGGNLTTAGALSVTGNANTGNLGTTTLIATTGNITTINSGLLQNGNSNIAITADGNISMTAAGGTVEFVITSTGANVAGTLNATGNANVGNLGTAGLITATGNVSGGNLTTAGVVAATGNVSGGNLTTAGALSVTGNANTGNLGTTTLIATTGNITTINSGLLQNGNSNIAITANGNVSIQAAGSTVELVVTSTGANISGTLNATGNANVGNIGATNGVFTNVSGNGSALSALTGANVTGQVANALVAGTVYTAAQPNITSVGTLTGLTMGGNVAMGNYWVTGLNSPVASTDAATKQYVDDVAQGLHTHDSCNAATENTLAILSGGTVTYNNGSSGVGATLTTTGSYTTIDGVTLQNGMRILVKNEANSAHNGIYDRTSSTVLTRSSDFDTPTEMAGGDFTFVNGGTLYDNTGWVMTDPVTTVGTSPVPWVQFSGAGTYTAGTGLTLTGSVFSVNASQTQITSVGTLGSLTVSGNASAGNISTTGALSVTGNANVGNIGAAAGVFTSVSGNGSALTALNASNISTGTLAQARLANSTLTLGNTTLTLGATTTTVAGLSSVTSTTFVGALTGAATTAGTVTTAAQPNITSVGTLSSLSVTGNANVGNIGAAAGVFTTVSGNGAALTDINASNISSGTLAQARLANTSVTLGSTALTLGSTVTTVAGLTSVTSTTFVGALTGAATTAGTVTTAAQPNITSVGTLTGLGVNGTVTAVAFTANTGVFTGNGSGLSAIAGANVTGTVSSATTAGTVTTAAQPNITSVGTLSSLSSSGNITAPNLIANTGMFISSVNAAVSAAGTVQGNATALTTQINVVSTVASGSGVRLPTAVAGMRVTIMNTAANALAVYPATSGIINSAAANVAFSQAAGSRLDFVAVSTTQWYTLNATYA